MMSIEAELQFVIRELAAGVDRMRAQAACVERLQDEGELSEEAADLLQDMRATVDRLAAYVETLRQAASPHN